MQRRENYCGIWSVRAEYKLEEFEYRNFTFSGTEGLEECKTEDLREGTTEIINIRLRRTVKRGHLLSAVYEVERQ